MMLQVEPLRIDRVWSVLVGCWLLLRKVLFAIVLVRSLHASGEAG